MSRVTCEELITTLSQPHRQLTPMNIAGIKLYILASSPIITSLTLEIFSGANLLFSKTLTFEEIKIMGNTVLNNWHGFIPFANDSGIYLVEGDYEFRLSANGYTFTHDYFIGWCKDRVCTIGKTFGTPPTHYTMNPYSYRLIEYKPREK